MRVVIPASEARRESFPEASGKIPDILIQDESRNDGKDARFQSTEAKFLFLVPDWNNLKAVDDLGTASGN